jgi:hypothetical protein
MIGRSTLLLLALLASSVLGACSSDDGKPSDGTSSGAPAPAPTPSNTPTGTPAADAGSTPTSAKKALTEGCVVDDDCASGTCYAGDQGSYCSLHCTPETAAAVCVAPMAGTCNKKGFCKKP